MFTLCYRWIIRRYIAPLIQPRNCPCEARVAPVSDLFCSGGDATHPPLYGIGLAEDNMHKYFGVSVVLRKMKRSRLK